MTAKVILDTADIGGRASSTTTGAMRFFGSTSPASGSTVFFSTIIAANFGRRLIFPPQSDFAPTGAPVVGLRDRVSLWDYGDEFRTLAVVEPDLFDNRLNEGRVGPDGTFWVGTMQNNLQPEVHQRR